MNKEKPFPVTWNQVAAFRLSRQHLDRRAPKRQLISTAGDMTGAQAQLLSAAQLSLWSRVRNLKVTDAIQAQEKRELVKATCMRQTLFLVPARELAIFVRGSARSMEKEIRWTLGKGVPERVVEAAIEATLSVLEEPLTRREIAERTCRVLGVQTQVFRGGGWGNARELIAVPVGELRFPVFNLLHLAGARGVICYGPAQGNEPTFVRADAWIPQWEDMAREQAEDLLLRKYLQAFGPATVVDFNHWVGMTLREAREIWARQQSNLVTVDIEGWKADVLQEDLEDLMQARLRQPVVRLLPYFDTFLLGHRERDHLVPQDKKSSVYRAQGWIAPVVLVDGRILGVWEYTQKGDALDVKVMKFQSFARHITAGIREEAESLGLFFGISKVNVRME